MTLFHRTGVIVVPAAILDEANHLANCFESSFPSAPVFRIGYQQAMPPNLEYAMVQPALRNSSITAMIAAIQTQLVGRAGWDNVQDEEGNYMIDLAQATSLLTNAVLHEHNSEVTEIILPEAQLWAAFDIDIQTVIRLAGLIPLSAVQA